MLITQCILAWAHHNMRKCHFKPLAMGIIAFNLNQSALAQTTDSHTHPKMGNQVITILDGYAFATDSDVRFNIETLIMTINQSDILACQQPGGLLPEEGLGTTTLITNNQNIGIQHTVYRVNDRLLYLTSETSNLLCAGGVFVDQLFVDGFNP